MNGPGWFVLPDLQVVNQRWLHKVALKNNRVNKKWIMKLADTGQGWCRRALNRVYMGGMQIREGQGSKISAWKWVQADLLMTTQKGMNASASRKLPTLTSKLTINELPACPLARCLAAARACWQCVSVATEGHNKIKRVCERSNQITKYLGSRPILLKI